MLLWLQFEHRVNEDVEMTDFEPTVGSKDPKKMRARRSRS